MARLKDEVYLFAILAGLKTDQRCIPLHWQMSPQGFEQTQTTVTTNVWHLSVKKRIASLGVKAWDGLVFQHPSKRGRNTAGLHDCMS
ncbi:hypothetical protein BJF96_g4262 [Verticillium dahliae]|uniref:Uncharacterized protein n=1 Tax=Verticillium dahliae TaxID=27337 RepID=A0AA44WK14_VERDA|nr:hypothetical protein BJF96_g4262 [Verticillium dahliae]